ncbi:AAA family ATPase [Streptomyces sp. NPDC046316]|uniref:AAA family ATPase n=1 Tax=Streptomyces sp. NPDC046316 TaxID=3154494 RepID=UPI0033E9A5B0
MQHAVGAPLPPDPSGWTPGAGRPSIPPVPPAPQGGHPAPQPHTHPQSHTHPQPPGQPHAAPPGPPGPPAGPPGPPPVPQAPGAAAPYSAPQAPGWGSGGGPAHPVQPGAAPRDVTGHVPLPPVALPTAPPAEPGTGTATLAVLLIGPAGAGKTTVARHWAQSRRVPTAHISLDDVREWVCSGFADPQSGWNEHSEAQYRLARRTCGFAARNFLANGISCILDDAVFPDRPVVGLGGWKRHVGPGLLPVVLLPGLEIVLERNAERSGNRRLSDEEVASIHGRMAGWYGSGLPIIDNSTYDVETTARVLDEVLARSIASPPAW